MHVYYLNLGLYGAFIFLETSSPKYVSTNVNLRISNIEETNC